MNAKSKLSQTVRWFLSVILVALGLTVTWAWGQVARLAEPSEEEMSAPEVLWAAWQPEGAEQAGLFFSADNGATWQPLDLPSEAGLAAWATDGNARLAVALKDRSVFVSGDGGESWTAVSKDLLADSLAWGNDGVLYAGTHRQGIYRLAPGGSFEALEQIPSELGSATIEHLAYAGDRLFVATPTAVFYTDDGGWTWHKSLPVPGQLTALAVTGRDTIYAGTETVGVYRSTDAGQTWEPAVEGLGLAAGQAVRITALEADPREAGVLYAAVGYLVGSSEVHFSAEGTFVTLDGGQSWLRLAGPAFPEARAASGLVLLPDRPLSVLAVTGSGFQTYVPDVAAARAALDSSDAQARAAAAKLLGMARASEASDALIAALGDPDPAVSLSASEALGRIADPGKVSHLMVALDHPDGQVRLGAARALGMMRAEVAVERLRGMLLNGEGATASVAAEALGRIGSPAAVDALLAALADPDLSARRHAALGALEMSGETAVQPLIQVVNDSQDARVRQNAAEALGWIGSSQATQALVSALKDRDAGVRRQAAWALGEIGDPAARSALERSASRDASPAVQVEAQAAVGRLAQQPQTPVIRSAELASTLSQLEPMRWLVLIASWVGAAWLAMTGVRLAPATVARSTRRERPHR